MRYKKYSEVTQKKTACTEIFVESNRTDQIEFWKKNDGLTVSRILSSLLFPKRKFLKEVIIPLEMKSLSSSSDPTRKQRAGGT